MTGRPSRTPWAVLVVVCFAQFMVVLDVTIVNVALPSIQRGLRFSQSDLHWVINGYTLTFGGFLLLGGRAGDLLGRKKTFVAGVVAFSAASLANGTAQSPGMLIIGRAAQGVGGAFVAPAVLSIITTNFPDGLERAKALAVWSGISATGGAVGLLLGGVLATVASWRWIFLVNVPIGVLVALAAIGIVEESHAPLSRRTFDVRGAVLVTAGLALSVFAVVKSESYGWGSARTWALLVAGVFLIGSFLALERRSPAPLMRLTIFRTPGLAAADGILLLTSATVIASLFFLSLYVQEVLRYGPLSAGLCFLPFSAGIVSGATAARELVPKVGPRAVAVAGLACATAGMVVLTQLPVRGHYASNVLVGLVPLGLGMGLTFLPVTLVGTSGVRAEDAGLASGLLNTAQQIGATLGLAVLSTLAANRTLHAARSSGHSAAAADGAATVSGFHLAFATATGLMVAAGLLASFVLTAREPRRRARIPHDRVAQAAACAHQVAGAIR